METIKKLGLLLLFIGMGTARAQKSEIVKKD